jgi:lactobin A/cerein 7B family class IIb bacteriocin
MERTMDMNAIRELTDAEVDAVEGGVLPLAVVGALMVGAAAGGFTIGVGIGLAIYF